MTRLFRKYIFSLVAVVAPLLTFASPLVASWSEIANLAYPVGCCFFLDDQHGFAGSGNQGEQYTIKIWITNNSGRSWSTAAVPNASGYVTQISIRKDGLGYASIYTTGSPFMNLWQTNDGGLTWIDISSGFRIGTGVGISNSVGLTKTSWQNPPDQTSTNGVFFMTDNNVLITPGPKNISAPIAEAWSAWGDSTTGIWYAAPELSGNVYCSFDNGVSWKLRAVLGRPTRITGHIYGSGGYIYIQTTDGGFLRGTTADTAKAWASGTIGGPVNVLDTRDFYVGGCRGEMVIAFDQNGGVWQTINGGDGSLAITAAVALTHPKFTLVPSCQNQTRTFTLINLNCRSFVIDSVLLDINTSNRFLLTSASLPDTITSADTAFFSLLFDPQKNPGNYTAQVHIQGYFLTGQTPALIDSIFTVAVQATPEPPKLLIIPARIDFDTASICGGESDSTIMFTNSGCDTVIVTGGPGALAPEFTIDGITFPLRIPPDSVFTVRCHFKPKTAGEKITYPAFGYSGEGVNASDQITFTGFGEDGRARLASTPASITFDTVTICGTGDSALVSISNTGCVPLILDSVTFAGDPDFSFTPIKSGLIAPSGMLTGWVYFTPKLKGDHSAQVTINSHSGSVDSTVMRSVIPVTTFVERGNRTLFESVSSVGFGTFTLCESRDTTITFSNTGCDTLQVNGSSITGTGGVAITAGGGAVILPPNKITTISLHAAPNANGAVTYFDTLAITSNSDSPYPSIPLTFTAFDNAQNLQFRITIDNAQGTVGSQTTVHLKADPSAIPIINDLDISLDLDQDLLGSLSTGGVNIVTQTSPASPTGPANYHISGKNGLSIAADSSIALFNYYVFLTKDTETIITPFILKVNDSIPGSGPCTLSASASGTSFFFSSQCGDSPMQRLMQGVTPIIIGTIVPNPTMGDVDIQVSSASDAVGTVNIISSDGVMALQSNVKFSIGDNRIHLKTSTLPSGSYVLVLSASGTSVSAKLTVTK